ncbi:MAG: aminotransferase class V-fold PLP-dependent enzyme [Paracoccaceae bacterium]
MSDVIYLNACGHGLPGARTLTRVADYMMREAEVGAERAEAEHRLELDQVRVDAARLFGTPVAKTGFGHTTSQLWLRLVTQLPWSGGRILISDFEWGDNVRFLQLMAAQTGARVEVVPTFVDGVFDPDIWQSRIDEDVIAICLPTVTSIAGLRFPVEAVLDLGLPDRCLTIVDTAQGVGRLDLSGILPRCDVAVATMRKWMRGPRQSAVFSLSDRAQDVLGLTVAQVEGSDSNFGLRAGLGVALAEYLDGAAERQAKLQTLQDHLRAGLETLGLEPFQQGDHVVGTTCLALPMERKEVLAGRLTDAGIVVKWPSPHQDEPLAPFDHTQAHLRIAPHEYNSVDDIDRMLAVLDGS